MNRIVCRCLVWLLLVLFGMGLAVTATTAELYFSSDKNGVHRVSLIDEGDEIFIVVYDPDENMDCDVRDKIWTDVKIMDPKTGAYIVWKSYVSEHGDLNNRLISDMYHDPYRGHWPGATAGWFGGDYLEETGADTGLFVSKRAFRVGTRLSYNQATPHAFTHMVDAMTNGEVSDFRWGSHSYADAQDDNGWMSFENDYADNRGSFYGSGVGTNPGFVWEALGMLSKEPVLPVEETIDDSEYLLGRFENMNTLVGLYQDPNDRSDVAISMMKISDAEATLSWDRAIYPDANEAATLTIIDPDENLDCGLVECVPVFILVNPGSWNPVIKNSPNTFCMLLSTGGVDGSAKEDASAADVRIRWFNIYNAHANAMPPIGNGARDGRYYVEYPTVLDANVTTYDTSHPGGITPVSYYAWETGPDTGVFQLNLNSILNDLGFRSLKARDTLAAYYLDPNDSDDFKIATAVIEDDARSSVRFTDVQQADRDLYWLGRDSVYLEVVDSNANVDPCCPEQVVVHLCDPHGEDDTEWLLLDEATVNSPVFVSRQGIQLLPVWDASGVGLPNSVGGWQLQLDNWRIEAFNEDDIIVRYNDALYAGWAVAALGTRSFGDGPVPIIERLRVAGDVAFDTMSIADTQVFDGQTTTMRFLDRDGNPVVQYSTSDCAFVEVTDPDQNEEIYRRERISAKWDIGQNAPFSPAALQDFHDGETHPFAPILGEIDILAAALDVNDDWTPHIYILNPRTRRWASLDLIETQPSSGVFVSTICIDLASSHDNLPVLDAQPGDTLIAVYRDPSNHSDSAWISIKVGVGGGGTPPDQASVIAFVDEHGKEVAGYVEGAPVVVRVTDPSHVGVPVLENAVTIDGQTYDLTLTYDVQTFAPEGNFVTEPIYLDACAGDTITATYVDPTDPTDTSSATARIAANLFVVDRFFAAPSPIIESCVFGYVGTGLAERLAVEIYDLSGHRVWSAVAAGQQEVAWDASDFGGRPLANGAYIYVITAASGETVFSEKGMVFVTRNE